MPPTIIVFTVDLTYGRSRSKTGKSEGITLFGQKKCFELPSTNVSIGCHGHLIPPPKEQEIKTTCFFDAAMGSEMTKGQGHTGIILFVERHLSHAYPRGRVLLK
jgi:hypothetical protein